MTFKPLDLDDLERVAAAVAKYHADKARYGGAGFEFHARAQTFLDGVAPALIARVRELEAVIRRILDTEHGSSGWRGGRRAAMCDARALIAHDLKPIDKETDRG